MAATVLLMRLVPDRNPPETEFASAREYTFEMIVEPGSNVVGKTLAEAGVRNFAGMYVAENIPRRTRNSSGKV